MELDLEAGSRRPHAWWIECLAGVLDRMLADEHDAPGAPFVADALERMSRTQRAWAEEIRGLAAIAVRTADPEELGRIADRARAAFHAAKSLERKKRRAIVLGALEAEIPAAD